MASVMADDREPHFAVVASETDLHRHENKIPSTPCYRAK